MRAVVHRDNTRGWEEAELDDEIRRIEDESNAIDAELEAVARSEIENERKIERNYRAMRMVEIALVVFGLFAYFLATNC